VTTTQVSVAALAARNVTVQFGGLIAVDDVSLEIAPGMITALIGPNGAGKTTLINVLSGMTRPTDGGVEWKGELQRKWTLSNASRAGLARTFQATRVFSEFTVAENVRIGSLCASGPVDPDDVLGLLELDHRADDRAGSLSFGELRHLGVALALATNPEVLLLDEPGAGLNGPDLDSLGAALRRIQAKGVTILLVDHNMRFVMRTAERVIVLEGGRVIADGDPAAVQRDEHVRAAYLGGTPNA
jgi:branched-chain amino acid transport system ATP-binding protein